MSDVITMARTAREQLAQALGALQAPGIPDSLVLIAPSVAQAMGLMHQLERAPSEVGNAASQALALIRGALGALQSAATSHPAVDQAMAGIASSLGIVHSLSQLRAQGAAPFAAAAAAAPQAPAFGAQTMAYGHGQPLVHPPQFVQPSQPMGQAPQPAQPQYAVQAGAAYAQPQAMAAPYVQPHPPPYAELQPPPYVQPQPAAPAGAPLVAPPAVGVANPYQPQFPQAAVAAPAQPPVAHQAPAARNPDPAKAAPSAQPERQAPTAGKDAHGPLRVEAALGAHSTTNFYKGLSGNDVIDSGGIFVATYNIPDIGQQLTIKVSMPGGYEFEARGVVRWCRDAPKTSSMAPDAPPGYGAQFTDISPEARQLVYRYVRNREPLFHDDM